MTGDRLRLTWRMQRWELAVLIGGPVALSIVLLGLAAAIGAVLPALQACWTDDPRNLTADCRALTQWGNLLPGLAATLVQATALVPFGVGILLGAPLVAREIEHRTAPIAWSLAPSRTRWLIGRATPLFGLVALALLLLGQASEAALRSVEAGELGFRQFGTFGPLVTARGLGVLALGIAVGLVAGRVLPAILVSVLLTVVLMAAIAYGTSELMRAEAEWRPMGDQTEAVHMVFDSGFRSDASGEVITWEEAYDRFPEKLDAMGAPDVAPEGWTSMWRVLPPEAYDRYVAREAGVFGAVMVGAVAVALGVVRVRRPT